jgi:hypothetical protein
MESAVYANYSPQKKSESLMFTTMWPMQTLGSFDLLYWKPCDQERRCISMPLVQEWLVLKSCYIYKYLIKWLNKKQFKNKDKIKTRKQNKV